MKLLILLSLAIVFSCKGKEKKQNYIEVDNSGLLSWPSVDTMVVDSVTTYIFEGKYDADTPRTPHTTPIKYGQLGLRGDPPSYDHNYISIIDTAFFGRLRYVPFVGEPKGYDTLPEGGGSGFLTLDTTEATLWQLRNMVAEESGEVFSATLFEDTYELSDSLGGAAQRVNGKWIIIDCQRALEIAYKLDSVQFNQYKNK